MGSSVSFLTITPHKLTSRFLSACPDLDYFRVADHPGLISWRPESKYLGRLLARSGIPSQFFRLYQIFFEQTTVHRLFRGGLPSKTGRSPWRAARRQAAASSARLDLGGKWNGSPN